jgi:peptidoglycan/LPS O-acetylase OafA/YrhL
MPGQRQTGKKRDQAIFTVLGYLAIVVLLILVAFLIGAAMYLTVGKRQLSLDAYDRWGGLAIFTTGMFGYLIRRSRRYWREGAFWAATTFLLLIHLISYSIVLTSVEHWNGIWFLLISIAEAPTIVAISDWSTRRFLKVKGRSGGTKTN